MTRPARHHDHHHHLGLLGLLAGTLLVLGVPRASSAGVPEDSPPEEESEEAPSASESAAKPPSLPKDLIDTTVKSHLRRIRACYQAGLNQDPSLAGRVVVAFVISSDGTVAEASTKESTLANGQGLRALAVESCIHSVFKEMDFPEPKGGGIVRVTYPFAFGTQAGTAELESDAFEGVCLEKPPTVYPEAARSLGVEGAVKIRILVDVDGTIVGNRDSRCTGFASARKGQRRRFWHPSLCIEASSAKRLGLLRQDALRAWGTSEWKPFPGERITPYFVNVTVDYRLQ